MRKIIVAEEDPNVRESLLILLSNAGYECIESRNKNTILSHANSHSCDLLLMDLGGTEGLTQEVLEGIHGSLKSLRIPVIIFDSNPIDPAAAELGARHVAKPSTGQNLLKEIEAALARRY